MRCFLACFTSSSSSKHNKRIHIATRDVAAGTPLLESTTAEMPATEPIEKKLEEEQFSFHLNYKIDEALSPEEAASDIVGENEVEMAENEQQPSNPKYQAFSKHEFDDSGYSVQEESSESLFSLSIYSKKQTCGGEKVTSFDSNDKIDEGLVSEEAAFDKVGKNEVKMGENETVPSNSQSRAFSKQECDDVGSRILVEEESSGSLFSLSIDSRTRTSCGGGDLGEKEVSSAMPKCSNGNSGARDQTQTQSVLTPLPQLKKVKATLHHQDKENINSQQDNTTDTCNFELLSKKKRENRDEKKPWGKDIAAETSLSSWLNEPETTPLSKGSAKYVGTQSRHILGALTVKQGPESTTTPTRRNSLSSDDTSILGTVGSYWRQTGQGADSGSGSSSRGMLKKYGEVLV